MLGEPHDQLLYTLTSADRPYRVIVDEMGEGAATVSERGVLLYVNRRLSELVGRERRDLVGTDFSALVAESDRAVLADLLCCRAGETRRAELTSPDRDGTCAAHPGLGDRPGSWRECWSAAWWPPTSPAGAAPNGGSPTPTPRSPRTRPNWSGPTPNSPAPTTSWPSSPTRPATTWPSRCGPSAGSPTCSGSATGARLDADADEFIDYITAGTARMQQLINDLLAFSRVDSQAAAVLAGRLPAGLRRRHGRPSFADRSDRSGRSNAARCRCCRPTDTAGPGVRQPDPQRPHLRRRRRRSRWCKCPPSDGMGR